MLHFCKHEILEILNRTTTEHHKVGGLPNAHAWTCPANIAEPLLNGMALNTPPSYPNIVTAHNAFIPLQVIMLLTMSAATHEGGGYSPCRGPSDE